MPKTPSPAARPSATNHPDVSDVAQLGYEQARDELVAVVARLEAGGASLEESLSLWERGEALAARCQDWLDGARERLATARNQDAAATGQPATGDDSAPGTTPEP